MQRWRLGKKREKIHGTLSKNLNCEKTDLLRCHFYFCFRLPNFLASQQKNFDFMKFPLSSKNVFDTNDHFIFTIFMKTNKTLILIAQALKSISTNFH